MREQRQKSRGPATSLLSPLPPEAAAALKEQVAQVAAALKSGQDLEAMRELVTPKPQDPLWDLHLLAALAGLAHPATPPLLAALFGGTPDKARRKALKRSLHLLKTRGVPVPTELLPRGEVSPLGRAGLTAKTFVSPIFGNGERYVILEGPREVLGGNFLVARLSDREGFKECHLLDLRRRQQQEFWEHFRSQGMGEWLTPTPAYAVRLLRAAYEVDPGAAAASRYGSLKERIWGHWGRPQEAPDLESFLNPLTPGEQSRYLEQSRKLALHPLFQSWLPDMEELAPWLNKLKEVQDSPLVLSEPQQQVRREGVVDGATAALYPLQTRKHWRERLLHMAYYLDLKGRGEEARAAQAAAADLAMEERGPLAGENPFLKALVQHALVLALEFLKQTQETAAPSGLVAPPSESLIIRR